MLRAGKPIDATPPAYAELDHLFAEPPMPAIDALLADLDGLAIDTQPQRVRRRSRDFYWYSPILKRELDHVTADAVVTPTSEAEVLRVMRACWRHEVPLTVRGGGTGNYGQAMPLRAASSWTCPR